MGYFRVTEIGCCVMEYLLSGRAILCGVCVFAHKKCGNAHCLALFVLLFYWILVQYELAWILLFLFCFCLFLCKS